MTVLSVVWIILPEVNSTLAIPTFDTAKGFGLSDEKNLHVVHNV